MVDFQSIAREYRLTDYSASGFPIAGISTLPAMRSDRTVFGSRLVAAREYAHLTQQQAAKGIVSQSTLAELERYGQGSSHTVKLAARYGVRAEWLADGVLPMVASPDSANEHSGSSEDLRRSFETMARAASDASKEARESAAKLVALVVSDPAGYADDLIPIIVRQLSGESGNASDQDKPEPKAA